MTIEVDRLSFGTWQFFYKMQAGLVTRQEFADFCSYENKIPMNVLNEQNLAERMMNASNPLLTQSVQYYYCTGMRDRERSRKLLIEAAEQGDAFAVELLTRRNGKW